jgi:PIN domain nuclease of toxin-antitoxin system
LVRVRERPSKPQHGDPKKSRCFAVVSRQDLLDSKANRVLQARGRIRLSAPLRDWVEKALSPPGIDLLALDAATATESTLLPGDPHGDPADRFLIAGARTKGVVLATRDENIIKYGKAGFVRVLEL